MVNYFVDLLLLDIFQFSNFQFYSCPVKGTLSQYCLFQLVFPLFLRFCRDKQKPFLLLLLLLFLFVIFIISYLYLSHTSLYYHNSTNYITINLIKLIKFLSPNLYVQSVMVSGTNLIIQSNNDCLNWTHAGTGFNVKNTVNFKRRVDLEIIPPGPTDFESTFIEIIIPNKKNIVAGCIYRHPSSCGIYQKIFRPNSPKIIFRK